MKNKEVAEAFVLGLRHCSTQNLHYIGNRLFSYQTCIAQWNSEPQGLVLYINETKYSSSTSKHQSYVRCNLYKVPYITVIKVYGIPINTTSLCRSQMTM